MGDLLLVIIIIGAIIYFYFNPAILKEVITLIQNQAGLDQTPVPTTIPPTTTIPPIHCIGEWSTWGPKCNNFVDNYHNCYNKTNIIINDKNLTSRVYKIKQQKNINGRACPYEDNKIETDYCATATSKPVLPFSECSFNNTTRLPIITCLPFDFYESSKCIIVDKNNKLPACAAADININCSNNDRNIIISKLPQMPFETKKPYDILKLSECNKCTEEKTTCPEYCKYIDLNLVNYVTTYKPYIEQCSNNICYNTCPPDYRLNSTDNKCYY